MKVSLRLQPCTLELKLAVLVCVRAKSHDPGTNISLICSITVLSLGPKALAGILRAWLGTSPRLEAPAT